MLKIAIGFLNYKRAMSHVLDNAKAAKRLLPEATIFLATENTIATPFIDETITIKDSPSVSFGKNQLLSKWHADEYDIGIIIEDDIIINEITILEDYIELLLKYKVGMVFCGYGSQNNLVFNKPNPRLVITTKDNSVVMFNALPDSSVQIFDLRINKELFDEKLKYLEQKEYLSKLKEKKLLPFLGVFVDLNESYKCISSDRLMAPVRPKNQMELMIESKMLKDTGMKYEVTHSTEEVLNFANSYEK